jgi:hypothetical protein
MKYEIEVPDYSEKTGIKMNWNYGFTIDGRISNNTVVIKANKEGLISLARHLLNLSQESIPLGYHFHLDESNSLEDGSCEIVIEKL